MLPPCRVSGVSSWMYARRHADGEQSRRKKKIVFRVSGFGFRVHGLQSASEHARKSGNGGWLAGVPESETCVRISEKRRSSVMIESARVTPIPRHCAIQLHKLAVNVVIVPPVSTTRPPRHKHGKHPGPFLACVAVQSVEPILPADEVPPMRGVPGYERPHLWRGTGSRIFLGDTRAVRAFKRGRWAPW